MAPKEFRQHQLRLLEGAIIDIAETLKTAPADECPSLAQTFAIINDSYNSLVREDTLQQTANGILMLGEKPIGFVKKGANPEMAQDIIPHLVQRADEEWLQETLSLIARELHSRAKDAQLNEQIDESGE